MIETADKRYKDINEALADIDEDNSNEIVLDLDGQTIGQTVIDKPHVTIRNGTIDSALSGFEMLSDGYKRGTFRTYSLFIDADDVTLENVTVKNSSGYQNGQAIALMVDGNDFRARNCRILSYQDTLFIAPLPEKEFEARGFVGPLEKRERIHRKAFFENCLVAGSIDFIFGGGMAYFHDCEIRSLNIHKEINGYVCAPNTPENERYGFIFDECRFTSEKDMEDSVYLARPWRDHGKCLIVNSEIGPHIKAEGYHDWDKPNARLTTQFKEYGNRNSTKPERVEWMKETSNEDLEYIRSLKREEER